MIAKPSSSQTSSTGATVGYRARSRAGQTGFSQMVRWSDAIAELKDMRPGDDIDTYGRNHQWRDLEVADLL